MSIRIKYEQHLKQVSDKLVFMCRRIEGTIDGAMTALMTYNTELARQIIDADDEIDRLEHDLEQDCLKVLLLEQPVAGDFRDVSAVLKMITDLERIADQSADICELILSFQSDTYVKELEHIPVMGKIACGMVKDSVHAYVDRNIDLAYDVKKRDDRVDDLFDEVKSDLLRMIQSDSGKADEGILFMMIAKYLERIADHAVNICEWVHYAKYGTRD